MTIFSYDFFELGKSSKVPKIFHVFILFYRIIIYWNSEKKRLVKEYFEVLELNKYYVRNIFKNCSLLIRLIYMDSQHEQNFHFGGEKYLIEKATSFYRTLTL